MERLRLALGVAIVAVLTVLAPSPAQAYPNFTCTVTDVSVVGGDVAEVTASVNPALASDFELIYQSQVHTDEGVTTTTAHFETIEVDDPTNTTVFVTVERDGSSVPCSGTIRLLPRDGDGDSDSDSDSDSDGDGDGDGDGNGGGGGDNGGFLPNTGGERLAWLIIGAILVLVGSAAVVASRRRDA
jgi:LPXTG-motif cell wall-anchored protein